MELSDFQKYFIAGAIFWVAIDFTTAFNPDVSGWIAHMPLIWVFYLGSPLLFGYLIYGRKWGDMKLIIPVFLYMLALEVLFFNNALLYTFPTMLLMLPAAMSIYSFLIYVPRWIVDKKLVEHKALTAAMFAVWAIIAVLSYFTRLKG